MRRSTRFSWSGQRPFCWKCGWPRGARRRTPSPPEALQPMRRLWIFGTVLLAISLLVACKEKNASPPPERNASSQPSATPQPALPEPTATAPTPPRPSGPIQFTDVTEQAGIHFQHNSGAFGQKYLPETMGNGACFLDYDDDGKLDLFVAHYVEWSAASDQYCSLDGKNKSYCTPQAFRGESSTLFHNKGNGSFESLTQKAGLHDPTSKALGIGLLDYDNDGWLDLFVANDTEPNKLYRNNHDGTFADVGVAAGVAFGEAGTARAGMGTDAADFDDSGREGLVVGNFTNEGMSLYRNDGTGLFTDVAQASGISRTSMKSLTFGCLFFDYDLDGMLDILAVNGHVSDDINVVQPTVKYAQAPHLFRNLGKSKFEEVTDRMGKAMQLPIVGRGAAYADFDNDGDLDLLIATNHGTTRLHGFP